MFSFPLFERIKDEVPEFEELTAFQAGMGRMSVRRQGVSDAPRPLRATYVTGNYFATVGVTRSLAAPSPLRTIRRWGAGGGPGVSRLAGRVRR